MAELIPTKYILRFLLVFGSGFSLVGLGIVIFGALPIIRQAGESLAWPQAAGVVTQSQVVQVRAQPRTAGPRHGQTAEGRRHPHRQTKYAAQVIYRYQVNGNTFESGQVMLGDWSSTSRSEQQTLVNRYPARQEVAVYYHPNDPQIAVLEAGQTRGADIYLLIGGIFAAAGLLVAGIPLVVWTWQWSFGKARGKSE